MFYDVFKSLCRDKGVSLSRACQEIGISKSSATYWGQLYRKGNDVRPDSYTIEKIANYFEVSADYLLERTDDPVDLDVDGNALAEIPLSYVEAADGDMKKARDAMLAAEQDALKERATGSGSMRRFSPH